MSVYMTAYRGNNRSYSRARASSSTSIFRSTKKDYEGSSMPLTPSCTTPFDGSTMRHDDVTMQMLTTQQPISRMNPFFNTTHPSNSHKSSAKGVIMQSDIVASRFGGEPTMVLQTNNDGERSTIDQDQLHADLNLRPQTAGNNGKDYAANDEEAKFVTRSIN